MSEFLVKQLTYDLSSQAGLALIGKYLKRINLNALVDPAFAVRAGIANSDILKSYLGLLCLGKNDFDAIEAQRTDAFFTRALHLRTVPSSPTLRQRFDTHASDWFELAERINAAVLSVKIAGKPINFGLLPCGYLGTQGFCLELALRPGTQHSACETEYNIERVLPLAARVSAGGSGGANGKAAPLLFRADSGFDSAKLMCAIDSQAQQLKRAVAFIIKWNPRNTPVETIAKARVADAGTAWAILREGKRACLWSESVELKHAQHQMAVRRIYRLTERTIDKHGQQMLLPEYVLEGWSTTLPQTDAFGAQQIIDLYADHGTHEQFHSEFKTDMDLVRLPSGKFDTNYLVCALAAVAMKLLRLIGQHSLHARQWVLGLGANDAAFAVFQRHWQELDAHSTA